MFEFFPSEHLSIYDVTWCDGEWFLRIMVTLCCHRRRPPCMVEVIKILKYYGIELIGVCHLNNFGSLWRRKNKGAQDFPLATVLRRICWGTFQTIWRVAKHTQSSLENWFGENNLNSHFHVACRSSHTSKQRLEVDDRRDDRRWRRWSSMVLWYDYDKLTASRFQNGALLAIRWDVMWNSTQINALPRLDIDDNCCSRRGRRRCENIIILLIIDNMLPIDIPHCLRRPPS